MQEESTVQVARYEYIAVGRLPAESGKKTRVFEVWSLRGAMLGRIKWHGAWRQYCIFPEGNTIWSAGCLTDLQDFLAKLKKNRAEYEG